MEYIKRIWEILEVDITPASDEYMELKNKQYEIYSALTLELATSQVEELEEFIRLGGDISRVEQEDAFSEGVSCGVSFVVEALAWRKE